MKIEQNGYAWLMTVSDRELTRVLIALDVLVAQDAEYYKDEAAMRDLIRASRRAIADQMKPSDGCIYSTADEEFRTRGQGNR